MQKINRRTFIHQTALASSAITLTGTLSGFSSAAYAEESLLDVIIIGGSYSGLSAALALARSRRKVLIIDSGQPCNRTAPESHNFLTNDGKKPGDIAKAAKDEIMSYPTVSWMNDQVIKGTKRNEGFVIETANEKKAASRKVLFATGVKDIMPDITGFISCWGKSVIHCPYCHGYEFRDKKLGILGNGEAAIHHALLIKNHGKNITIFTNGKAAFEPKQMDALRKNNIQIVENKMTGILHHQGLINAVQLKDRSSLPLDVLYSYPQFKQHCEVPVAMGCEMTDRGLIKVDQSQQSSIKGIYASGDNSSFRSIAIAVATGSTAGAAIHMDLAKTDFY